MNKFFFCVLFILMLISAEIKASSLVIMHENDIFKSCINLEFPKLKLKVNLENKENIKITNLNLTYKNLSIKKENIFKDSLYNIPSKNKFLLIYKQNHLTFKKTVSFITKDNNIFNSLEYSNHNFSYCIYQFTDYKNTSFKQYYSVNNLLNLNRGFINSLCYKNNFIHLQLDNAFTQRVNSEKVYLVTNLKLVELFFSKGDIDYNYSYGFSVNNSNILYKVESKIYNYSPFCGEGRRVELKIKGYVTLNFNLLIKTIKFQFEKYYIKDIHQVITNKDKLSLIIKTKINKTQISAKIYYSLKKIPKIEIDINNIFILSYYNNHLNAKIMYHGKIRKNKIEFSFTFEDSMKFKLKINF